MKIDAQLRGQLPSVNDPTPFVDPDSSIRGWRVAIPGGRPLATPAVVDGRLFLGGGFGSYEFYAFDAATGKLLWQYQMSAGGYATPATFEAAGQQFVIIAAGGGGKPMTRSGDAYYCFALPKVAQP
jgi:quinoprotein glucose dehydrogenase